MTDSYRIALWATNLCPPFADLEAWLDHVEEKARDAAAKGAKLLLMPEYAAEAWLGFKPEDLRPDQEMAWLATIGREALPDLRQIARTTGISLLPGTMPWTIEGRQRNRAWLMTPDGSLMAQDKLCLTPFEKDAATWDLTPGDTLRVVELDGLRVVILVCLDVELPALSCLLAPLRPDLVLVPSMTYNASGHARVFSCAKARAVELMAAVACTGVIGASPGTTQNDQNVSGNAVYIPCEPALGYTGTLLETQPTDGRAGELLFDIVDLPIATIRQLRRDGAEVWPGAWANPALSIEEGWHP
jgi:predicted amidohydrolase